MRLASIEVWGALDTLGFTPFCTVSFDRAIFARLPVDTGTRVC